VVCFWREGWCQVLLPVYCSYNHLVHSFFAPYPPRLSPPFSNFFAIACFVFRFLAVLLCPFWTVSFVSSKEFLASAPPHCFFCSVISLQLYGEKSRPRMIGLDPGFHAINENSGPPGIGLLLLEDRRIFLISPFVLFTGAPRSNANLAISAHSDPHTTGARMFLLQVRLMISFFKAVLFLIPSGSISLTRLQLLESLL